MPIPWFILYTQFNVAFPLQSKISPCFVRLTGSKIYCHIIFSTRKHAYYHYIFFMEIRLYLLHSAPHLLHQCLSLSLPKIVHHSSKWVLWNGKKFGFTLRNQFMIILNKPLFNWWVYCKLHTSVYSVRNTIKLRQSWLWLMYNEMKTVSSLNTK